MTLLFLLKEIQLKYNKYFNYIYYNYIRFKDYKIVSYNHIMIILSKLASYANHIFNSADSGRSPSLQG